MPVSEVRWFKQERFVSVQQDTDVVLFHNLG